MNIQQGNDVIIQIENLLKSDIDKKISDFYKDQAEVEKIQIRRLNVGEFLSLTKRLLNQIEKEIESENRFLLPFVYNVIEVGQFNLDQAISTLNSQISNNQLKQAENMLFWLGQYSLQNGFFDKSKYKLHTIDTLKFQEQKDKLDLLYENFKNLNDKHNTLISIINKTKEDLESFYKVKQEELQQISSNLNTTINNTSQIQELLNQSNQSNSKITSISEQIEKEKSSIENTNLEINSKLEEFISLYNKHLKELQVSDENFKELYNEFSVKLDLVEEKTGYFEERNEYLNNLIGREVGASLFETFKQRKTELDNPLGFWRWSVLIMGALTFAVVLSIFTNFFGYFPITSEFLSWGNIVVNFLKSSPFFFLLYYCISQYNKERNFQEEYAFKSASALTIKAYADILTNEENKDQLILKAVYNVYRSPLLNLKNANKKDINNLTDLLNEVAGKTTEIIRKE